ncbi:MAG: inorganic phosphate transporter [Verrucomicrobiota bacterium]
MITLLLLLAVGFLAYSNGANDNFKGVASLYGSRSCGYKTAISWATLTTFAGGITALFLAQALLAKFSGKGLVPDEMTMSPRFILAVAVATGGTVILATKLGFPVSTTHAITGGLVGAGLAASPGAVNFMLLGKTFVVPLILSPLIAVLSGGIVYLVFRSLRRRLGISKDSCLCAGVEPVTCLAAGETAVPMNRSMPQVSLATGTSAECTYRYAGNVMGLDAGQLLNGLHFLSAGAVSFARGLNDTPKIAGLLLVTASLDLRLSFLGIALAMAAGGLLGARRVAETMSHRITTMSPGQGFAANLSTALLVSTASLHGLPVSTTHVSVGSLLGMGIVTAQTQWQPLFGILASWVVTLPSAGLLAGIAYAALRFP